MGSTQVVGTLKDLVPQPEGGVVGEQIPEFAVVEIVLDVEVNGDQHPLKHWVVLFNSFGRLFQLGNDDVLSVLEVLPSSPLRHIGLDLGMHDPSALHIAAENVGILGVAQSHYC